jgi:nitrilase
MKSYPKFKVAAMHVSPVFLDTAKTVDKACSLIEEAASNGASLVAFPETYVPAFPLWSCLRAPGQNHEYFKRLLANAVHVPGPEVRRIAEVARRRDVMVCLGINEGTTQSPGCLWNTNLLIGPDGRLLNHHRKLVPTYFEKLTWANGDGAGLRVVETKLGRVGTLICGENSNALARHTLLAQGEQVHIANYPSVWLNGGGFCLAQNVRIRAEAHSTEAKCFTIAVSMYLSDKAKDILADGDTKLHDLMDEAVRCPSLVVGPNAELRSPIFQNEEGICYGEIDVQDCVVPKQFHDLSGYYNRFDVFQLSVDRSTNDPVSFVKPRGVREQIDMDLTTDDVHEFRPRAVMAAE